MLPPSQVDNDSKDEHMQEADGAPILIPPPDIKSWADESARFVASVMPRFEKTIIAYCAGLPEYSFMNVNDPYHAYYRHRLSELHAQNGSADDGSHFWLKGLIAEARKSATGNKITTSEWLTQLQKRRERHMERPGAAITVASPITGEMIPTYEMSQHMQDPKYKEQKERLFAKIREATLAQDDDRISTTIAWLAWTRPDVFGTTEEEFYNAVKTEITLGAAAVSVVSPITSELIPAHELSQHLEDPKYKEEKERLFAKIREATAAKDDRISATIAWLARRHPDVFGTTVEEFANAVKTEIESTELALDRLESSLVQNISLDDSLPVPEVQFLA